jgi:hypothetical protein
MLDPWLRDIEPLEAICRDEHLRRLFLKLAVVSRSGRMESFLAQLAADGDVDEETKLKVAELGRDEPLLLAVEEYLRRTDRLH